MNTSGLTNIPPQAVLQSERWGEFSYVLDGFTPGSENTLTLYFTENYFSQVGQRQFNVVINNEQVLSQFDPVAEAGAAHKAVEKSFTLNANGSGQYLLEFQGIQDHALLNAILVNPDSTPPVEEPLYQAKDLVGDGVFTGGIEGPAVGPNGELYAVNFHHSGSIGVVNTDTENANFGQAELFVDLPAGSIGNGIRFNAQQEMLVADYVGHNILKVDLATRAVSVYAHDSRMNQPNDIAIAKSGTLYASDPNWSNNTGNLWKIDTQGKVTQLQSALGTTNGVEVCTDERTLYVGESVQQVIWAYDILDNGDLANKRLFYRFNDFGLDGMRCDAEGNLFVARYGAGNVAILSPQGTLLREVKLKGQKPTNVAFGGKDGKTVYVTLQDRGAIETFRTEHAGRATIIRSSDK